MPSPDIFLFSKVKKGDLQAFENLFRKYYNGLCMYANTLLKDNDTSEEIVQELFCRLWENRDSITINSSVKSYLYKAVYNNCLQYHKNQSIVINIEDNLDEKKLTDFDASEIIKANELNQIINKTMDSLPDKAKKIFKMSRFEGLKYKEIAEKMSISVKTVESLMGKALKIFRHNLKEYH